MFIGKRPETLSQSSEDRLDEGAVWVIKQEVFEPIYIDRSDYFEKVRVGSEHSVHSRVTDGWR